MDDFTSSVTAYVRERARVRQHLAGAEMGARGLTAALDPLRALNRALLLDELGLYRRRGRFPLNHESRRRAFPAFVDGQGTRCAVAHLMEVSGHAELVQHIARTRNTDRVRELARLSEVRAWLAAAGLSAEEAARIQPEYCFLSEAEVCFCRPGGAANMLVGTVLTNEPAAVVRIDRVEGEVSGVSVGDEVGAFVSGVAGTQVLLVQYRGELYQAETSNLSIVRGSVICDVNPDTAQRPVTVDTAITALMADEENCVDVLASDDSLWNRSQCEGGSGREGVVEAGSGEANHASDAGEANQGSQANENGAGDTGEGCTLGISSPPPELSGMALTSAAIFAALIRRRQRAHG